MRDYIHVTDLCSAHELGLRKLLEGKTGFTAYNLGTKNGISVLEIVKAVQKHLPLEYEIKGRREGDPAILIADPTKAEKELGWRAE